MPEQLQKMFRFDWNRGHFFINNSGFGRVVGMWKMAKEPFWKELLESWY
jgi:hypothetical protein